MTYHDLARRVLLKLTVIGEDQDPSATQTRDITTTVNALITMWQRAGYLDLGFVARTEPSDTLAVPDWADLLIVYATASLIAEDYGVQTTREFDRALESARRNALAIAGEDNEMDLRELPMGQAR